MLRRSLLGGTSLAMLACAAHVQAQTTPSNPPPGAIAMPAVSVTAPDSGALFPQTAASPDIQRFSLPQTTESIGRQRIEDTVNAVDTEDAVKYLPSIFVRKRNYGDTQPVLATRTWGVNSSARSLVFVDDVPISALISNNNTNGAPRWGMVAPSQIQGIDMLYGPFAAQYAGNSMGGVMLITTRMPETFEVTASQTAALQTFDYYKTSKTYPTSQTAATVGGKEGALSWFLSGNVQDSYSQPLGFVTNATAPAGTTGTIAALNKVGAAANVVGASGLLHTTMYNVTGKAALDITDWLRATYTLGLWDATTQSRTETYLRDAAGNPTYGGVAGFGSNTYARYETHMMNALSFKTDTHGNWDGEAILTRYDFLQDIQRSSAGVGTGLTIKTNGLIARQDGTNWMTADLKAIWRPTGPSGAHEISFGVHRDAYTLNNPTYNTPDWQGSGPTGNGTYSTYRKGQTETAAFWLQEAWKFAPGFKLTIGGRLEQWTADHGYNLGTAANGTVFQGAQPTQNATTFSPKMSLSWQATPQVTVTGSYGQAHRFPTVAELYQIVATGSTFTIPNPNLTPETANTFELAIQHETENTRVRLSLFQENTTNALVQQTNLINNVFASTWQNVGETRNRGAELVTQFKIPWIEGLELSNSVTFVDSRILSDPTFGSATGTTATGKHVPNVPDWRDTVQLTYRPNDELAMSVAAKYSGKMYSTLDNTDSVSHVYGAFDQFFVVDTHVRYQVSNYLTLNAGIDNIFNHHYFEFHPFAGRTYLAGLKLKF